MPKQDNIADTVIIASTGLVDFLVTAPIRPVGAVSLAVVLEDSSNLPYCLPSPPDTAKGSLLSSTSTTSSLPSLLS
jgi:hypothetical protein